MQYFVTTGRGTESFTTDEIQEKIAVKSIHQKDGKVYFTTEELLHIVAPSVWSLKAVERVFVCVLHDPLFQAKRGWKGKQLFEKVITGIARNAWTECHQTWQTCAVHGQRLLHAPCAHDSVLSRDDTTQHDASLSGAGSRAAGQIVQELGVNTCSTRELVREPVVCDPSAGGIVHEPDLCNPRTRPIVKGPGTNNYNNTVTDQCSRVEDTNYTDECINHQVEDASHIFEGKTIESTNHKVADKNHTVEGAYSRKRQRLDLQDADDNITFRVSCKVSGYPARLFTSQELCRSLGVIIKHHTQWKPELRKPQLEIYIQLNNQGLSIGLPITRKPLSERVYLRHIGLRTPVAYIMVRLAQIQPGAVVVDPMCGSGTILIEAAKERPCAYYVGSDINLSQLTKSAENIKKSGETQAVQLIMADATELPLPDESVDTVISDLPFGNNHGCREDMYTLYPKVLQSFNRILKHGGHCVLLTSVTLKNFLLKSMLGDKKQEDVKVQSQVSEMSHAHLSDPDGKVAHDGDPSLGVSAMSRRADDMTHEDGDRCGDFSDKNSGTMCKNVSPSQQSDTAGLNKDTIPVDSDSVRCHVTPSNPCSLDNNVNSEMKAEQNDTRNWSLKGSHYVKLGETHAFICSFTKK